ncbi:hypothetical protein GCM10010969_23190 [Saccharibacillus kuerlensis]|uniref:Lipoprotein n=1 Tax=Saccharibacillus kuerlensis TaxID=459527 RepID=A0ABQ2L3Y4_9BACL|nr:hypothetical protein GCM10010969_23190 [Saccharibacillus kuerlensis]
MDYSAEYEMTLISSENEQGYALSLGSDPKMNGLLVKDSNSYQGYSIPLKDAEKLRDILGK